MTAGRCGAAGRGDDRNAPPFPILIGDIGGTNSRFAIVADAASEPGAPLVVKTASYASIDEAIRQTVLDHVPVKPRSAMLAVAGPVDGDEIALTNCSWIVRPKAMFSSLGLSEVVILNDFEAQALAVAALGPQHLEKIGGGEGEPNAGRVVLGPGTGLGVAGLIRSGGKWIPVPGEGGHMDIGPRTERDRQIFPHLETIEGRISGEQILCGRGLVNAYRAIARADGVEPVLSTPAEITAASDAIAREAVRFFVTCLGRTAGDLALVFMSRGGVYLTGGIAPKIVPALKQANFREAFEDKAPHRELMKAMPIYVITHPLAALAGLGAYARTPADFGVETAGRRWRSK